VTAAIHYAFDYACAVYLVMYYTFSQPRAVVWQMYVVTVAIYYACTGMADTLSQVRCWRGCAAVPLHTLHSMQKTCGRCSW
jgi:hypothetical protein